MDTPQEVTTQVVFILRIVLDFQLDLDSALGMDIILPTILTIILIGPTGRDGAELHGITLTIVTTQVITPTITRDIIIQAIITHITITDIHITDTEQETVMLQE